MSHEITVQLPNTTAELRESQSLSDAARCTNIVDAQTFEKAADLLKLVVGLRKRIETSYKPVIDSAHAAHKAAIAARDEHTRPLDAIEGALKTKCSAFQAIERARIERERLEEEERQRKAAALAAHAEEEARAKMESQRIELAAKLEAEGRTDEAKRVIDAAVDTPVVLPAWAKQAAPVPQPIREAPKSAGIGFTERWSAEVTDKLALIRFVAANPQHMNLLDANQTALNQMARAMKSALAIDGVRAVSEMSTSVRS